MKKWLLLFVFSFYNLTFASPIQTHTVDPEALSDLATALNLPQTADIVAETQKHWLRKPGQERWELTELSPDQRQFVLNWATAQGFFAPWKPLYTTYDKALILGATTSSMQKRLDYLKQLWKEGTRFNEIVWLTGDRPLDAAIDSLTDRCNTESEAAHILWREADIPEEMRNLPVVFVATPMKVEGASLLRPNTADTIITWLKITPEPCTALFVSNQPYCGYQFAVIKATLPNTFLFDLVGQGTASTSQSAAIILDSIARWIYLEDLIDALDK